MSKQQGREKAPPLGKSPATSDSAGPAYTSNADMVAWLGLGLAGCSETPPGATDDPLAYAVTQLYPALRPDLQDTINADRLRDLTLGIYQEEAERANMFDWVELGDTLGPGQLGEPAYTDVTTKFPDEWKAFREHYAIPEDVTWDTAIKDERSCHFFTVGYLIIIANKSAKPGRSDEDALKFGVGRYHGGYQQMKEAQDKSGETVAFDPLRPTLDDDFENYVDGATSYRSKP